MSTLTLKLPNSLHRLAKQVARREQVPVNQIISNALAEKLSALATEEYLKTRAARADSAKFDQVMAKIKRRPPLPGDELP